jgi:hypothetical protein
VPRAAGFGFASSVELLQRILAQKLVQLVTAGPVAAHQ